MGFIGSINAETRKWLGNNGPAFDGREVWVGCSGAFTVEQILSRYAPKAKIRGNDVNLYSSVLGAYLAGQPFRLEVREEKFAWVEPYLGDVEAKAAAVMVLFEALKYEKGDNLFRQRHWAHYLNNFEAFHQGTVARLRERKKVIRLEAYTTRDIYDLLDELPRDAVAIAFLPTYAGGYERMFRRLEEIFDWDRPAYGLIDAERKAAILEKMKRRDFLFLDDRDWPDLPLVAVVRKARMRPVYVYSNMKALRPGVLKQQRHAEFVPFPRFSDQDEITPESKLTIIPTTNRVVNYYRDVYLSKAVGIPADGDAAFLVAIDGKVFGFLIFSRGREGPVTSSDIIFLMADFVVPSTKYRRLAKLLLLVTQTKEMAEILKTKFLTDWQIIRTAVFTDKPVSMKYRGVYELEGRKEGFLKYKSKLGKLNLTEVVQLWLKKFEKP